MRADRLVAALLLLQARGRVTAAELAAELEVSVATARRDLEGLSAAGIPVYPQAGRGGGWQLLGGARTDLTGLTAGEAQALFLLLGPTSAGHPQARAALRKLVRALPATFREDALAAADAVVVDPARWGRRHRTQPRYVDALRDAVVRRSRVRLAYRGASGQESTRVVDPWGLVTKNEIWYLIAGTDQGRRTFRLDRVRGAELTGERFQRPADLDVSGEWDDIVDQVEARRAAVTARITTRPEVVPMLRYTFGRQLTLGERPGDGAPDGAETIDATVAGPSVDVVARLLASFADSVVVREPPQVRARLAELGARLVAVNSEAFDAAGAGS